jgi:hypothetical protein
MVNAVYLPFKHEDVFLCFQCQMECNNGNTVVIHVHNGMLQCQHVDVKSRIGREPEKIEYV